ncbi:hypothetical protein DFAR_1870015 [Desulfarculales bacterium]
MNLRHLKIFANVYECRSFSRAADEVLLSQPTVSGHIKSLEPELGVRLGRERLPTRGAELLYEHAKATSWRWWRRPRGRWTPSWDACAESSWWAAQPFRANTCYPSSSAASAPCTLRRA